MAFLSTAGSERLCSGMTTKRASARMISAVNWFTSWPVGFKVAVIHGQRTQVDVAE